ncbi:MULTISPECIES: hypothetical protein [Prauserella salsuginis group]|uniref:Uncharacterized protein n=2 Tax=Prauserella salsuginis group TaxID=2893672 RepID=A0A839XSQ6_9PSEU|nr:MULTISPECIES: hypothetical protein [Prauserella salsuginis group]MBB3663006.1 hypothetical protein [Prauserella sediminis]MCR3721264.1 hypothetical protein [Prauserella flava]MCR3734656.1 hypothetical protein [Prauserella salsuginis]
MSIDRTDALVAAIFVVVTGVTVGVVFDVWHLVYYAIPSLVTVFMLMGSLNRRDEWKPGATARIVSFGAVLTMLFVVSNATLHSSGVIGGLPASTAVFVYVIWPLTSVVGPLLFAWVYHTWLRHDVDDAEAHSATQ